MAEAKTKLGRVTVPDFMAQVAAERLAETQRLIAIFQEVTGFDPVIWGGSMVGFGRYAYQYPSGRKGGEPCHRIRAAQG